MWLARMPIFWNLRPWEMPGVPSGTTKLACPREPSEGSTEATITCRFASPPLVIQVFAPLSVHSSFASS